MIPSSLLQELLEVQPHLRPQMYFKSSLTALSHAMEDQVLAGSDQPLVIACFQRERFYRQEAHRYLRIAERTPQLYVLAAPETDFKNHSGPFETIAFDPEDPLSQEWHLVVVGQQYSACLICQEHQHPPTQKTLQWATMDQARRFEGIWTFERQVCQVAAQILLQRICHYRPELTPKIQSVLNTLDVIAAPGFNQVDPGPFAQRLVTYLQAGQYRQLKAYRQIAIQERQERLVNSITSAIRRSLNSHQVLKVAVQELGKALQCHRCIIYRCSVEDEQATIQYEYINTGHPSLLDQTWPLNHNPWVQQVFEQQEWLQVENVFAASTLNGQPPARLNRPLTKILRDAHTYSLLLMPVLYQGRLLGMVELHHSDPDGYSWGDAEIALVEAIATQVGIALIQAQAYADLEDLNQQLEALDRTRSNLIAITGHELRTPLSTIQVCLESLANEPDMSPELQQVMLSTALSDAERMRKLVQDFLTLSRLESGRVEWNPEALALRECVDLALSSTRTRQSTEQMPQIQVNVPEDLPLIQADGEWIVEVLAKLLDNACKFTSAEGSIQIQAKPSSNHMLEVTITDTGRGIEPDRLEAVFDRFYQEEGALRRSAGGTGLGLAICRQIIQNLGGQIWAESEGKDRGSIFHFTIPRTTAQASPPSPSAARSKVDSQLIGLKGNRSR
nr:DICT sensory domain-containing protein [Petrachloros mirabilis]